MNGFMMIFVSATIPVNFGCAGGPRRANYLLKLVDYHLWVSSVADGYRNMELQNKPASIGLCTVLVFKLYF